MSTALTNTSIELHAESLFDGNEKISRVYRSVYESLARDLNGLPGVNASHMLLVERCAYFYAKSIDVAERPEIPIHIEQAYSNQFNRVMLELGRETRTLQKETVFKDNLIKGIVLILTNELKGNPDLLDAVSQKLDTL